MKDTNGNKADDNGWLHVERRSSCNGLKATRYWGQRRALQSCPARSNFFQPQLCADKPVHKSDALSMGEHFHEGQAAVRDVDNTGLTTNQDVPVYYDGGQYLYSPPPINATKTRFRVYQITAFAQSPFSRRRRRLQKRICEVCHAS